MTLLTPPVVALALFTISSCWNSPGFYDPTLSWFSPCLPGRVFCLCRPFLLYLLHLCCFGLDSLFLPVYTLSLGYLIQSHSLKCYIYAEESQIYVFKSDLSSELQTFISNYLPTYPLHLRTSLYLKLTYSKLNLWFPCNRICVSFISYHLHKIHWKSRHQPAFLSYLTCHPLLFISVATTLAQATVT